MHTGSSKKSILPSRLRQNATAWERHRGVALAVIYFLMVGNFGIMALVLPVLQFGFGFSVMLEMYITLFGLAVYGLQMFLFYRYGNLRASGMAMSYTNLLLVISLILISGGYQSALVSAMLCSTVMAFRILPRTEGIRHSLYVALFAVLLYLLAVFHVELPNWLSGFRPTVLFVINWSMILVIIGSCMATFHYQHKKLFSD